MQNVHTGCTASANHFLKIIFTVFFKIKGMWSKKGKKKETGRTLGKCHVMCMPAEHNVNFFSFNTSNYIYYVYNLTI